MLSLSEVEDIAKKINVAYQSGHFTALKQLFADLITEGINISIKDNYPQKDITLSSGPLAVKTIVYIPQQAQYHK